MEGFITWEMLTTYTSFVTLVFMVVEFTKGLKIVKKIPTKWWSFFIALLLLITTNIVTKTFKIVDILLYILSAMSISLGSNGLSNFNKERDDKSE